MERTVCQLEDLQAKLNLALAGQRSGKVRCGFCGRILEFEPKIVRMGPGVAFWPDADGQLAIVFNCPPCGHRFRAADFLAMRKPFLKSTRETAALGRLLTDKELDEFEASVINETYERR